MSKFRRIDEKYYRDNLFIKLAYLKLERKVIKPRKNRIGLNYSLRDKELELNLRLLGFKFKNKEIAENVGLNYGIKEASCRYCTKPIKKEDIVITEAYYQPFKFFSHKNCKKEGYKEEAYECQKIDSDCNDCKYFDRIKGSQGNCTKFNKEVEARANFASGLKCFTHRKD